jgi:hypothetical protein
LQNNPLLVIYIIPIIVGTVFENKGKTSYEIGNAG